MTRLISQALDSILDGLLQKVENAPRNAVINIEIPSKGFCYEKAVGEARPDSHSLMVSSQPFHWASITKMVTATLILQLLEEGYFGADGLDRTLGELAILPQRLVNLLHLKGDGVQENKITLRHLLTHTSGMRDCMQDSTEQIGADAGGICPDSLLGHWFFDKTIHQHRPHPMRPWDAEADPSERFAGVINFYCYNDRYAKAALSQPGEDFHYSDTGFVILGLIIEAVTNKPFHQSLTERIFNPLSLKDTYMAYRSDPDLGSFRQPEAEIYLGDNPCHSAGIDLSFDWGGGGIVSSASSLKLFFQGLISGKLFKHPSTLNTMLSWQTNKALKLPRTGVGLGIFRTQYPSGQLWGHSGAWGAKMFWDPDSDIYLSGTINQAMGNNNWHWPFFEFLKNAVVK